MNNNELRYVWRTKGDQIINGKPIKDGSKIHRVKIINCNNKIYEYFDFAIWKMFLKESKNEHQTAQDNAKKIKFITKSSQYKSKLITDETEQYLWEYFTSYYSSIIFANCALESLINEKCFINITQKILEEFKESLNKMGEIKKYKKYKKLNLEKAEYSISTYDKIIYLYPVIKSLDFYHFKKIEQALNELINIRNDIIHYKYLKNRTYYEHEKNSMNTSSLLNTLFPRIERGKKPVPPKKYFMIAENISNLINNADS